MRTGSGPASHEIGSEATLEGTTRLRVYSPPVRPMIRDRGRNGLRLLLVLALVPCAVCLWPALLRDLSEASAALGSLEGSASERSRRALSAPVDHVPEGVPEVFLVADLLRPVFDGLGALDGRFVLVLAGSRENPHTTLRAHSILTYDLAPFAWSFWLPLDMLESWIGDPTAPGGLHPELLQWIDGTEVFVFQGISSDRVAQVRETVRRRTGTDILVPGVSVGERVHVLLIASLPARIASGDPAAQRYRGLLR
jgi:hypothetical protein